MRPAVAATCRSRRDSFRRGIGVLGIVATCAAPFAQAGDEPPSSHGLRRAAADLRYLVRKPAHLDDDDRSRLAAVFLTTVGLYATRHEIQDHVRENRTPGRDRLFADVRTMGKGAFAPAAALVAWTASLGTHRSREKETALLLVESASYSAIAAGIGSFVLATERPEDGDAVRFFAPNGHGVSLDAALAASVVPPLRRQYLTVHPEDGSGAKFWKRAGTTILYAGAVLTALQRVYDDKHWAPDAFLGTMTGLGVGETLCEAHGLGNNPVRIEVMVAPGGVAVAWTIPLRRSRAR